MRKRSSKQLSLNYYKKATSESHAVHFSAQIERQLLDSADSVILHVLSFGAENMICQSIITLYVSSTTCIAYSAAGRYIYMYVALARGIIINWERPGGGGHTLCYL